MVFTTDGKVPIKLLYAEGIYTVVVGDQKKIFLASSRKKDYLGIAYVNALRYITELSKTLGQCYLEGTRPTDSSEFPGMVREAEERYLPKA
ncbi:MAG: hypothetical protein COY38_04750 [Candidatus Aenigmarchaeota archaeon CG_4_10_14_0_8_um_filter_37_24]|nr:hypothetical protein [Candidatus Aenigmarchaeota archaeon]OIN85265.1 MAG: hypothetical protein AUJ50_05340 [Candidatus Aenigmarchaeota archaeon CG1_02_38_14]PIV69175.1 MAG: hypothetical protein COS07_01640 [Candidatus Aenigmarchaeota archaeon CG01_land_8_20_14_3_00_37_9]PIW41001.1 MAG: hypothetical protein COW21_04220 [Candidatus Aenigmarchaeota archaeon CG15_BIG_FIL_POST_REV_8_21_14_020_37_27]PIX50266.1 MAG: hypothetical protein COZ52_05105 [Candidatus Aenigmarchaeota archaeon CG_4_8_14_3_u